MTYFEKLTDGLQLHEVAMFVLGGLLFMVLLFLIVLFALRKRQLKPLLLFFIIPIVMLGWPSIAKIQLNQEGLMLVNNLKELEKYPDNETLQNKVEQSIQVLEEKNVNAPDKLADIARAKYLLGKNKAALETISKIPEADKAVLGVADLQRTIHTTQDIERKLEKAKASPTPESLEILKITKAQIEADHKFSENVRLQRYVNKSDSLIKKNR
ncbi:EGFR-like transmembrane domain-containing protein [Parapedobacter sp. 10938]|uniref:EGFR-like transmembrane domain-containing protein n=1 Tax=Parapedobacter flavus TaxID=3110225 RepID=UPI002DB608E7|nr:transmembrane domain-containing protein [Parapedobacter sp. 10938]MEC3881881.1 transmembrane domain-containing protein [Parapedobacter sp. 10938]